MPNRVIAGGRHRPCADENVAAGEVDAMLTARERAIADHERRVDDWESFVTSPRGLILRMLRATHNRLVFWCQRR